VTTQTPAPLQEDPEALIEEARDRARRRRRRQRRAVLAATALVALAVVAVVIASGGIARDRAAGGAGVAGSGETSGGVRYLYTRAVVPPNDLAIPGLEVAGGTVETWVGSDGSWRERATMPAGRPGSVDMIIAGDGLFPPQANATSSFDGALTNPRDPGDGLFTAQQLRTLPTSTTALTARLEQALGAQERRNLYAYVRPGPRRRATITRLWHEFLAARTDAMLIAISDLEMSPLPARLVPPLARVARSLPHTQVSTVPDPRGGREVRITYGRIGYGGFVVAFNARSGALRQGTTGVVVAQAPVSSLRAIPGSLTRIRSGVPSPPAITLKPATATAASALVLRLAVPAAKHAPARAPRLMAQMFGPTGPDCTFWASRPPVARIPDGTITRGSHPLAVYGITPHAVNRSTWCAGRYQILVSTANSTTAGAIVPRSFAAVYFTVR
jgi:hypothetical protein